MNPALGALLAGATFIALSPIFVRVSEAGPTATAFWRVALAVPALWMLYWVKPKARARRYSGKWLLLIGAGLAFAGDALGVVTAMFYAGYLLAVKGLRDRGETTLHLMAVTTTITAIVLFPVALITGEPMLPASATGWWVLIGLALVSHAAGQGLIAYALAHLPAAFSSVSLLFQPVMAALFAWLLLAEPLVPLQVAGGLVVLIGIYLARRGSA
jgi:drug/metabolite transporter (DMT)-like permease